MIKTSIPRLVISGLRGGSGKTILSLSLITALKEKYSHLIPFKKGPDYIDAGWMAKIAGVPCYNLDLFMMTPEQAVTSFNEHTIGSDVAIIEGNRGLFDGVDHEGTYSTAVLSKILMAPVILIIDCTKATNTIAAMVLGCKMMDPEVDIGGIVLNRVATARQESVIRKSIEIRCGLPVLGAFPRMKKDPFPERHMGLTPFQEHAKMEEAIRAVSEIGMKYLDIDEIVNIANSAEESGIKDQGSGDSVQGTENRAGISVRVDSDSTDTRDRDSEFNTQNLPAGRQGSKLTIGIIRDSAFQFYYQENFEELVKRGAKLIEVSPLKERELPEIDALYIGGGFPETHAISLAENEVFMNALFDAIQKGLPVYAECGGLMYLGKSINLDGSTYPMVNALPLTFGLEKSPRAHGYTIVEVSGDNPYFEKKTVLKGHEFHYSSVLDFTGTKDQMAFCVKRGKGIIDNMDGICYKNVLASYTHLHAIGSPEWADGMVNAARKFKLVSEESG